MLQGYPKRARTHYSLGAPQFYGKWAYHKGVLQGPVLSPALFHQAGPVQFRAKWAYHKGVLQGSILSPALFHQAGPVQLERRRRVRDAQPRGRPAGERLSRRTVRAAARRPADDLRPRAGLQLRAVEPAARQAARGGGGGRGRGTATHVPGG